MRIWKFILIIREIWMFILMIREIFADGSYNSFRKQIGYCQMQSYYSISRSSSDSVSMFKNARVQFGVGLSEENMKMYKENLCGACLEIYQIDNFYEWNLELTEWNYSMPKQIPFIVMVFDQCTDPICRLDFLDFDIYNEKQPVAYGNPTQIRWKFIPCPILSTDYIEYLICTAITCKQNDSINNTLSEIIETTQYYFSIAFRNMRIPIKKVCIHYNNKSYILRKDNVWTWNFGPYNFKDGINMTFIDVENKEFNDLIQLSKGEIKTNYHGGIYVSSNLQN